MENNALEIYVDGSYSSKTKRGGIGLVVVKNGEVVKTYSEEHFDTTNNRMELWAIIVALREYGVIYPYNNRPIVYSDSAYAVNSFNSWIYSWEQNDWMNSKGKTVENLDLMKTYFKLKMSGLSIDLRKCDGHVGIEGNELADKLATGK